MNNKTRKLVTRQLPMFLLAVIATATVGMFLCAGQGANAFFCLVGMAVTANQLIHRQDGNRLSYPAAVAHIYEGTLVFINAAGFADDDTASGVNEFGGIAIREVDNTVAGAAAGDLECETWATGVFELTGSGFAATDLGVKVYATDNYTISLTAGGSGVLIGECVRFVSSTKLMVKIEVSLSETAGGDNISAEGDITLSDGGTVTQITTAATGVTLSTHSGQITTVTQNIAAAGEVTFVVTNTEVTATSNIIVGIASGSVGGTTIAAITAIGAGVFSITLTNLHASVAETGVLVINFAVIGGSAT